MEFFILAKQCFTSRNNIHIYNFAYINKVSIHEKKNLFYFSKKFMEQNILWGVEYTILRNRQWMLSSSSSK